MSLDWRDRAVILSSRRYGESGHIVTLMTHEHGRHAGLLARRGKAALLEPGTFVSAHWRARLADQLGRLEIEGHGRHLGAVIDQPLPLAALSSACALVESCAPERTPMPELHAGLCALIEILSADYWAADHWAADYWDAAYVQWEVSLLSVLGFGLSLDRCAATGTNDKLAYVSPRSGRAVSLSAGEPYAGKLLALPPFLIGQGGADPASVLDGLLLTGFFLERHLLAQAHKPLPGARLRYLESYRSFAGQSTGDSPGDSPGLANSGTSNHARR